ncbi:MAG: 50S ribosomal protein L11 methyltransferase [Thermodesulfobacteriota bacterium]|nr:50S ribosomal protein L11 methyltransferase [Thermodesulfobacteriota bacterium]
MALFTEDQLQKTDTVSASGEPSAARGAPWEHLYIYYLKGRADTRDAEFNETFIGTWEEDDCSFLFFYRPADEAVAEFVGGRNDLVLADRFDMAYDQWQPMDAFPLQAGGMTIYSPWRGHTPDKDTGTIVLDPGVVFGSGFHSTTRDCLEALELICYKYNNKIQTALDIGTGTGLLAIAGAFRAIPEIVGVDLNFLAARTARQNIKLNNVDKHVIIVKGDAEDFTDTGVDLIIANIHHSAMKKIVNAERFLQSKFFILSGMLRTPARDIADQLGKLPVRITKIWNNDGIWYTFAGEITS